MYHHLELVRYLQIKQGMAINAVYTSPNSWQKTLYNAIDATLENLETDVTPALSIITYLLEEGCQVEAHTIL